MISLHLTLRPGWNVVGIMLMIVLGSSLVSCAPTKELATPYPTLSAAAEMTAASISVTPAFIPTDTSTQPAPALFVTPNISTLTTGKISSIPFGNERGIDLSLDNHYLYWAGTKDNGYIFRMSIHGGMPEKIAKSTYAGGRLDLMDPILSGKWLIFADTDTPNDPQTWKIRALNLEDRSERLVLDIKNDTSGLIGSFEISADGDRLVWTLALPESDEDSISMLNLATGEKHEVLREKTNGLQWWWSIPAVSAGRAIIEKDFDVQHGGGGSNIYQLDLANGKTQDISTDRQSSMPHFIYPWVVWKASSRYDSASQIGVYNLQTKQKKFIPIQGVGPSDPLMDGTRVYWTGLASDAIDSTNSIYIFDIIKNTTYRLDSPAGQVFDAVAIHGNLICWLKMTNFSGADLNSYLEWTTIP